MSDNEYPVTVAVDRGGRVEQVRVGTAVRRGDGFELRLGALSIGAPVPAAQSGAYGGGAARTPAVSTPIGSSGSGMTFPNYGRSKGQPIAGATEQDLEYYAAGARRSLSDPAKSRFHDKERSLLAAIEAEMLRQRGMPPMDGGGAAPDSLRDDLDSRPPPSDDDIPF